MKLQRQENRTAIISSALRSFANKKPSAEAKGYKNSTKSKFIVYAFFLLSIIPPRQSRMIVAGSGMLSFTAIVIHAPWP